MTSWRSMMKIKGSVSGSISQRRGSPDPDPHQNVMDTYAILAHCICDRLQYPCIFVWSGPVCPLHRRQGGFLLLPKRRVCHSCGILWLDQGGAVCHSSGGRGAYLCHRTGTQSASSSSHNCRAIDFGVLFILVRWWKTSIIEHFACRRRKRWESYLTSGKQRTRKMGLAPLREFFLGGWMGGWMTVPVNISLLRSCPFVLLLRMHSIYIAILAAFS